MHILWNPENTSKHAAASVLNYMKLMMASGEDEFGWHLIICLFCYINILQVIFTQTSFYRFDYVHSLICQLFSWATLLFLLSNGSNVKKFLI